MSVIAIPHCGKCNAPPHYMKTIDNEFVCARCGWVSYEYVSALKRVEEENLISSGVSYNGISSKWFDVVLRIAAAKKNEIQSQGQGRDRNYYGTPICPICEERMISNAKLSKYGYTVPNKVSFTCSQNHSVLLSYMENGDVLWEWNDTGAGK